ncbi:hypothetical protein [Burkholderia singularis]|uniref:hypothetical protein n=1 Tax=Burkholderia singularis TaxID=1503053 RepID=UPI0035160E4B
MTTAATDVATQRNCQESFDAGKQKASHAAAALCSSLHYDRSLPVKLTILIGAASAALALTSAAIAQTQPAQNYQFGEGQAAPAAGAQPAQAAPAPMQNDAPPAKTAHHRKHHNKHHKHHAVAKNPEGTYSHH